MLHLPRDHELHIFRVIHYQLRVQLLRSQVPVAIVVTLQGAVSEAEMRWHQRWRHRECAGFVHICLSKSEAGRDRDGGQRGPLFAPVKISRGYITPPD